MKFSIETFWPNNIGRFINSDHNNIKKDILEYIDDYMKKNDSKRGGENINLFESDYNIQKSENESIKKLTKFMSQCFFQMAIHTNKKHYKNQDLNCIIKDMWFIKYKKGGFVLPHDHGKCSWCCVYYLQAGANSDSNNGSTYFYRPTRYPREEKDFGSLYNYSTIKMPAEEGTMLVWPNYLLHGSMPYEGKLNRIIFSANASVFEMNDKKQNILS